MALLSKLPGFNVSSMNRGDLNLKDSAAAEALNNLAAQATFQGHPHHPGHMPHPHQPPHYHVLPPHQHPHSMPGMPNEPGPSTHPRGPPDLGQLAQTALQNPPAGAPSAPGGPNAMHARNQDDDGQLQGDGDGANGMSGNEGSVDGGEKVGAVKTPSGGRRGGRSSTMSNDEWTRQRKDNHKEVERRRRGNINEGINELGRIVPNGSGEKAKGAILSRAVQYIHHLKENEARNIEKWTLEKLLMDQAMGDLQAQLEEMRRMWDEERVARQRAESELDVLRGLQRGLPLDAAAAAAAAVIAANAASAPQPPPPQPVTTVTVPKPTDQLGSKSPETPKEGVKRDREESDAQDGASGEQTRESDVKRQRVD